TLGVDIFMANPSCATAQDCANQGGQPGDVCVGGQCHLVDGVPTHGDGSVENPGCDENGDGLFNDSKMFQGKGALLNVISAFGQVEFALESYFQTEGGNTCSSNAQCNTGAGLGCTNGRCVFCDI